ncbi:MAG: RecQ family ATP-dependent DNA helicase [Rhodococcus sp. (in: high G+C Gram-positive bacteria)]|uniref:RecQ family ATP-dependent DNA helicase n=1 Tax=Rhodococcus sp. TaxID=1831 RepID=UPI003BB176F1
MRTSLFPVIDRKAEQVTERQREELQRIAREDFGWDILRPGLLDAMEPLLSGRDVLAAMRTGYGKSAIYQVAAAMIDGITLVISPLIALQHDQVAGIEAADDAPIALALNSTLGGRGIARAWDIVTGNGAEYLFLSPEQLAKEDVLGRLAEADVSLIVVDEAHCVAAWGHDFRPDFLRLGAAVDALGHPPVLALTATASPPVREEIITQLRLRDPVVVATGFDRPNLHLEVQRYVRDVDKQRAVLARAAAFVGPGLVYVATRKDAAFYAGRLAERGLRAAAYHGGMRAAERAAVHQGFRDDRYDVVVATSAFGMGIDKPGIRFVLHEAVPESLDNYYQEIGRAGRDGEPALALLFYRPEDLALRHFFAMRRPQPDVLRRVYEAVPSTPTSARELRALLDIRGRTLTNALNLLEQAGAVRSGRDGFVSTAMTPSEAVAAAVHMDEVGERMDRSRVEMMRGYAETYQCRRQFLLGYFGEQLAHPCGNCDRCDAHPVADVAPAPQELPFPIDSLVTHDTWGDGVVMRVENDRITVLFDEQGYRTLSLDALGKSNLLHLRAVPAPD